MEKKPTSVPVLANDKIAEGIYSLWIETAGMADEAVSGQFVSLYCRDRTRMLPRPISICEIDRAGGRLRLVYRVAGRGTDEFSHLCAGDTLEVLGPLGSGFPIEEVRGKRMLLVGGGIGIPPLLAAARALGGETMVAAGYKDVCFLEEEFQSCSHFYVATEDGSKGVKGTVLTAIDAYQLQADGIFACGPRPMLRAVKEYALAGQIPCWVSMEERMACGIGACLACVCPTTTLDEHSNVHNRRVCKDGPVFLSTEVEL